MALQESTTYALKHLISLLYNSFDEYVFNEKANFFIKAWQSTQLSRQYNYTEANTCLFWGVFCGQNFHFSKSIKMVDKIKILTSLMSLFQPIKFVVAKSYFVYCNYVSSCIVNM